MVIHACNLLCSHLCRCGHLFCGFGTSVKAVFNQHHFRESLLGPLKNDALGFACFMFCDAGEKILKSSRGGETF